MCHFRLCKCLSGQERRKTRRKCNVDDYLTRVIMCVISDKANAWSIGSSLVFAVRVSLYQSDSFPVCILVLLTCTFSKSVCSNVEYNTFLGRGEVGEVGCRNVGIISISCFVSSALT